MKKGVKSMVGVRFKVLKTKKENMKFIYTVYGPSFKEFKEFVLLSQWRGFMT